MKRIRLAFFALSGQISACFVILTALTFVQCEKSAENEEKEAFSVIENQRSFEFEDSVEDWSSEKTSVLKRSYLERIYQRTN